MALSQSILPPYVYGTGWNVVTLIGYAFYSYNKK
jgi:hypothetical protein